MKLALDCRDHVIAYADLRAHEPLDLETIVTTGQQLGARYVEVYRKPGRGRSATDELRWELTVRLIDGHVVKRA